MISYQLLSFNATEIESPKATQYTAVFRTAKAPPTEVTLVISDAIEFPNGQVNELIMAVLCGTEDEIFYKKYTALLITSLHTHIDMQTLLANGAFDITHSLPNGCTLRYITNTESIVVLGPRNYYASHGLRVNSLGELLLSRNWCRDIQEVK